jgi:ribosomal protein S18 acetylase RimI-like enzyme
MTVITVTAYEPRYRQQVLDLFYRAYQVHIHLDWYSIEQWLETGAEILRLAWDDHHLVGVMGAAQPLHDTSWIRLILLRDRAPSRTTLRALWDSVSKALIPLGVRSAWLLLSNETLSDDVRALDFEQDEWVVTLRRQGEEFPEPVATAIEILPLELDHLEPAVRVDHAAFAPPWQLDTQDLYQAVRQSDSATIALLNGEVIGYQLSTRYRETGHLARLAVMPDQQGKGVGGALLRHMIAGFLRKRVATVTVNTQLSNVQSQRLYEYYGFRRNHFDLPVWKYEFGTDSENV